jgi:hypothetical protein
MPGPHRLANDPVRPRDHRKSHLAEIANLKEALASPKVMKKAKGALMQQGLSKQKAYQTCFIDRMRGSGRSAFPRLAIGAALGAITEFSTPGKSARDTSSTFADEKNV